MKNELHTILQRSNIKLTGYLSNIFGKTEQALFQLFINGEVLTLESVGACLHGSVKASPKDILQAMDGKISLTDRRLLDDSLDEYQFYTRKKKEHDIEQYILFHFPLEYELLQSIPGVKQHSAAIILAEIGPSIEAFKTVSHLASWAGLSPGSYESAGKKKSSRVTRGNNYLKTVLITSGGMAGRSHDPAFGSLYHRVSNRETKIKAVVACGHKLLRIIYKILDDKVPYNEKRALSLWQQKLILN